MIPKLYIVLCTAYDSDYMLGDSYSAARQHCGRFIGVFPPYTSLVYEIINFSYL